MCDRARRAHAAVAATMFSVLVAVVAGITPARATTIAPPPCNGALTLYTRLGTLAAIDGSHRRPADVEARLAILHILGHGGAAERVGWAYVDGEGDLWVGIDPHRRRAVADWRKVAPSVGRRIAAYALVERLGFPAGYRLSACS